ncbi:MAG: SUMF1/EgtB/PvdO family nonheme iron enzyme [Polyangiaceae bacterium]
MSDWRPLLLLTALSVTFGCEAEVAPPREQWLVTISTDARVPQFGDRLRVEVLDESGKACNACQRIFDASDASTFPLSFGVVPTGGPLRVRARLLRADTLGPGGEPPPGTSIDLLVPLDEVSRVHMRLSMACYGLDASAATNTACDPDTGALVDVSRIDQGAPDLEPDTWDSVVPCASDPPTGMACIEGASFLLGDAAAEPFGDETYYPAPETLVRLDPFYLDVHELTVGDYLALRREHPDLPEPVRANSPALADSQFCSYRGPDDLSTVDYPLNCVSKSTAMAICEARELRLPTEAEWEFAAGSGTAETLFPWGSDGDVCAHAIVARAELQPAKCRATQSGILPAGPAPSTGADATSGGLFDLGGSLSEWVADDFAEYGADCWSSPTAENPICSLPTGQSSVRGGSWNDVPVEAGVVRRHSATSQASATIGLRCAL